MKAIMKRVFFWTFILFLGAFLLITPQYMCVFMKNYMVSRENAKEMRKEKHWVYNAQGRRYVSKKGSFVHDTSQEIDGVTYYFDSKGYVQTCLLYTSIHIHHMPVTVVINLEILGQHILAGNKICLIIF